jgi:hypothetical protein
VKTLRRRRPVDDLTPAPTTSSEHPTLWATARHLDETITLQGFTCLHDCRWPGTRNGRIDHVVIGATGVWVIHDVRPLDAVSFSENTLRAGKSSLSPELRRVHDQAAVLRGMLGDTDVQPILSVHDVPLPRHSFQVDDVRVAASLWPTSQVMARPSAFLEAVEVESLALVAIEALRPTGVAGPRTAPPGAPSVSLPFVPCGSAAPGRRTPWAEADAATADADEAAHRRRHRILRRSAAGAVVALMALGVAVELTGDTSSLAGDPVAEAPAGRDATPRPASPDV